MRTIDMFMREQVMLLWIIEGNTYLRAHKGYGVRIEHRRWLPSMSLRVQDMESKL